ncbi:hypothetical protein QBC40DRAFT_317312 [Triangularia verruculosa]|uniref:Uncharacterized protein n=1 Tax=Triangularia verruculosa TaxID=2587418 RepID=A0AAN6XTI7_9PEZI|nr:hypothetical protein QBC40DRAFT_317312 [Triangularia verruculosa]
MTSQKRLKSEHDDAPESKRVKSEADASQVPTAAQSILPPSAKTTGTATQPTIKPEPSNNITIKHETEDTSASGLLATIPEHHRFRAEHQAMDELGLLKRHCRIRIKTTKMDPKSREYLAAETEVTLAQATKHYIKSGDELSRAKELMDKAYECALKAMQAPSVTPQEYRARLEREMDEELAKRRKKREEERAQREKEDQKAMEDQRAMKEDQKAMKGDATAKLERR